jgi:hypothetical protein
VVNPYLSLDLVVVLAGIFLGPGFGPFFRGGLIGDFVALRLGGVPGIVAVLSLSRQFDVPEHY